MSDRAPSALWATIMAARGRAGAAAPLLHRRRGTALPTRAHSRKDAERALKAAKALGVAFVALGEPDYPRRLQMIDDAPPLLAVRGQTAALHLPAVAVVGARNASAAGLRFAERLARDLRGAGFAVVPRLAPPPRPRPHAATSATARPRGSPGAHDLSPPRHPVGLPAALVAQGALLSEPPPGHAPGARVFPRRNRLISGLCAGIVVVEAAKRSGSL